MKSNAQEGNRRYELFMTHLLAFLAGFVLSYMFMLIVVSIDRSDTDVETDAGSTTPPGTITYKYDVTIRIYNATNGGSDSDNRDGSGNSDNYETYEVTAYTAGAESTGKTPADPSYGITASGATVEEGVTAACPPELPFGTRIYIPYFDNTYTCQDRGAAITAGHIDVYMDELDEALAFGRRELDVKIIEKRAD